VKRRSRRESEHNHLCTFVFGGRTEVVLLAAPKLLSDFLKIFSANAHEARLRHLNP
jgi:hypothetical protein